jgi:hypothetical protein
MYKAKVSKKEIVVWVVGSISVEPKLGTSLSSHQSKAVQPRGASNGGLWRQIQPNLSIAFPEMNHRT